MAIKISKVIKDLNVGRQTIEEFLHKKGIEIDASINARIQDDVYEMLVKEFKPDMCGIGPFIPHRATPFRNERPGSAELTLYLLSIIRLIHPPVLLPATTALGTILPDGREQGILYGANVVMPNLSPVRVRKKYELYDNKICTGEEAAECVDCLSARMKAIGFRIVTERGDIRL